MTFAIFPLGVQADNYNIDFSVENPTEYLLNSKACKESEDEEDVSLMSESEGTLLAVFEGEGTEENPFILSTPQHFQYLAVLVNTGNSLYKSAYYRLGNSIDFSGVNGYIPIGKVDTKLDYPGEGDFAKYKPGTYNLSASVSAVVDSEYGQIDVGSKLFSGASVIIEKSGKATVKLNFKTADINISEDTSAKFFVSDSYGVDGVKTGGNIGYLKKDGTSWVYYGSSGIDKVSIAKSSTGNTVIPSYELDENAVGVKYITYIEFPFDALKNEYSLALTVDSDVFGAQLGGMGNENPVTLNVKWNEFTAPVYSESEYEEKIIAKHPFSGTLDGNGYALKNLTINSSERLVGIFGLGYNACVENLRIENITINARRNYTMNVGALFGCYEGNWAKSDLHITGCHADGKIVVDCEKNAYTGGLIGVHKVNLNAAVVRDCRVDMDITSVSATTSYVGGMIATIDSGIDLSKCVVTGEAYGEAEGDANPYTGGIAARIVYDDWIGTTSGYEEASLMAQQGYSLAEKSVASIKVQSVGIYRPLIGNIFSKVLDATVRNCYYDSTYKVEGTLDSYDQKGELGSEKTAEEIFDKAFLSDTIGLDFENTWIMVLGIPDVVSKDPYIAYKKDGTAFNVQPVGCGSCKVIAAAYDSDGRVVASRIDSYTEGTPVTLSFEGVEYEYIKIFAFDSRYSPLCEAETYTVQ